MEGRTKERAEEMKEESTNSEIQNFNFPFLPTVLPSFLRSGLPSCRPPSHLPCIADFRKFKNSEIRKELGMGWRADRRKDGRMCEQRGERIAERKGGSEIQKLGPSPLCSFLPIVRPSFPPFPASPHPPCLHPLPACGFSRNAINKGTQEGVKEGRNGGRMEGRRDGRKEGQK